MTTPVAPILDLRGTACPLNYVRTRIRLERMRIGESLEVWLDHGEPATQVPRSLSMDGQEVAELPAVGDWSRLSVRRQV